MFQSRVIAPQTLPPPKKSEEILLSRHTREKKETEEINIISELKMINNELVNECNMMKRYLKSLLTPREYHWSILDFTWSTRLYVSEVFCFAGIFSHIY